MKQSPVLASRKWNEYKKGLVCYNLFLGKESPYFVSKLQSFKLIPAALDQSYQEI